MCLFIIYYFFLALCFFFENLFVLLVWYMPIHMYCLNFLCYYLYINFKVNMYLKIQQQHFRMPHDVLRNLFLPVHFINSTGNCKYIYKSSLKTILFSYIVYYLLNNTFTKQFPYAIENLYTCTMQL